MRFGVWVLFFILHRMRGVEEDEGFPVHCVGHPDHKLTLQTRKQGEYGGERGGGDRLRRCPQGILGEGLAHTHKDKCAIFPNTPVSSSTMVRYA